jgi:antitoxin VapB
MAFHVRDPKTDALVRELARSRGIGITEAVREAVEKSLAEDAGRKGAKQSLWESLRPLLEEMDRYPRTGLKADKKFFDELWGEGDD